MSVEGLDIIKQKEQNNKVEITGLDFCRPVETDLDMDNVSETVTPFEPRKINVSDAGEMQSGSIQGISGLDMCKPVTAEINSDCPDDFSEDIMYPDEIDAAQEHSIVGLERIKHLGEPNLPKISSFAVNLIKLVNRAKELDTNFKVFGADKHQYQFNTVTTLSIVRDFEKRHRISFPQSYVDFLTQVGDGGAGPDLGVYSLDEVEYNNYTDHCETSCDLEHVRARSDYHTIPYTIDEKEPIVTSALDEDKWFEWYESLGAAAANGMNFRKKATELYNGLVEICAMGGTNAIYLICEGDLKGKLCAFTLDIDDRVHIFDISFEDWMLNHFKRIVEKFEGESSR